MTLKRFTDWPIRELEQDPIIYLRGYLSYAPLNGHTKDFAPLFEKQYCKGFNLILYAGPAFKFMVDDLQKATGYKLRWTSSFVGIKENVTEFKNLYTPVPWARKYDRKYPEYFSDKPLWKDANGHLKINGHNYGPLPSMPQLEQGINASVVYSPGFVGNDYIKYWWFDPLYPNDSGKWWYRKKEHYGKQPVATPGLSNHGWGISVDLHNDVFKNAKAVDWLANNMASYGFAREPNNENDRWHITYYKVTDVTPQVLQKFSQKLGGEPGQDVLNYVPPEVLKEWQSKVKNNGGLADTILKSATFMLGLHNSLGAGILNGFPSTIMNQFRDRIKDEPPVFSSPAKGGAGAFGRQATVLSAEKFSPNKITPKKINSLPNIKNTGSLSPKIFEQAQPYNGFNDPGTFLTYDEFFEMMIHPLVGNFSLPIAAIFTAIASREGNLEENKISIATANGDCHLGFLQLRCRPESLSDFTKNNGWIGTSLLWTVPYSADGQVYYETSVNSTNNINKLSKKYAWEAFIQDQNIIKQIKIKAAGNPSAQKEAKTILYNNMPKHPNQYGPEDVAASSKYIADWARIPANQVWMMKSKFHLPNDYFNISNETIQLPYMPQVSNEKIISKPWRGKGFLFDPWNASGPNTWKNGADVNVAFNVIVNYLTNKTRLVGSGETIVPIGQAKDYAMVYLRSLLDVMEPGKKTLYSSWLSGIND